jgi:hypothetical protein
LGLLEKADPGEDGDYEKALEANKVPIQQKIDSIIRRNGFLVRYLPRIQAFIVGTVTPTVVKVLWDLFTKSFL